MLLVRDRDNLLYLFRAIEEAHDYIEWQDVEHHEYDAVDEMGRVYTFVLRGYDFDILPTDRIDPAWPLEYLRRFTEPRGIAGWSDFLPLDSFDDWQRCLDRLEQEMWKPRRRCWQRR